MYSPDVLWPQQYTTNTSSVYMLPATNTSSVYMLPAVHNYIDLEYQPNANDISPPLTPSLLFFGGSSGSAAAIQTQLQPRPLFMASSSQVATRGGQIDVAVSGPWVPAAERYTIMYSDTQITTSLTLFKYRATNLDLRRVLHPITTGAGCNMRLEPKN